MTSNKKIVRIVGILFLVQMTAAILSYSVILDPILYKKDFLESLSMNNILVTTAVLLDLVVGLSVFGIAVLLYPILKKYNVEGEAGDLIRFGLAPKDKDLEMKKLLNPKIYKWIKKVVIKYGFEFKKYAYFSNLIC